VVVVDMDMDVEGFTCMDVCEQVRRGGVVWEFVDG
jgi:hypothetical protein